MKIELKNIRHSETLSEETNAFTANIYIDGTFAGYARNDGQGGNTDIRPKDPMNWDLIKEAEAYCSTLPERKVDFGNGEHAFKMDLETVVDELLEQHLNKKHQQQFERKLNNAMGNGIVFGAPESDAVSVIRYKVPIATLLTYPHGEATIKQSIELNIAAELKGGAKILNTNIPEKILKAAGLREDQYLKPKAPVQRQQKKGGRNNI